MNLNKILLVNVTGSGENLLIMFVSLDEPLLLASVQSELLLLGVHSSTLRLLSSASRPVFSLDYNWARQRVYWLSPDYQSIRWADMKSSGNTGTLIKGMSVAGTLHLCDEDAWLSEWFPKSTRFEETVQNAYSFHLLVRVWLWPICSIHMKSCHRGKVRFHRNGLGW